MIILWQCSLWNMPEPSRLSFSVAGIKDIPKENHGNSILFQVGVASCIYDLRTDL